MDPAVSALQNAINRFALAGSFPRVDVDGLWGTATKQGVINSLSFIGQGKCYQGICPHSETSQTAAQLLDQWDQTQASARGLAEFIAGVAGDIGLPHVAAPVPAGSGGGIVPPVYAVWKPGLVDRFKTLPTWQQILIGLLAGLGLVAVANRIKRR